MNMTTNNPTPEIGDYWRRIEDGRIFVIQKLGAQYASGVWVETERKIADPDDEKKTRTVKVPECAGGVLTRSLATARFKLDNRGRRS